MSKEKNIVYEWAKKIKNAASRGYSADDKETKDACLCTIFGFCEGILCTMDGTNEKRHCRDCKYFHIELTNMMRVAKCECGNPGIDGNSDICPNFFEKR